MPPWSLPAMHDITHIQVDRPVGPSHPARIYQTLFYLQAEARLAARRQARYEARNIRMRELERKQKEEEDNNGSLNTAASHQLIQNTSSTNSNHNSIHSGKHLVLFYTEYLYPVVCGYKLGDSFPICRELNVLRYREG